jgi:phosphoserine phosphatase RsbU/P
LENGKGRLLVVGGNQPHLQSLTSRLAEAGYQATLVEEGPWTPERFGGEAAELLLLDTRTPDLDAARFVTEMRASDRTKDLPIIILSPAGDLATVERCLAVGAEDYLLAPFSPVLLKSQLSDYLEVARRRHAARDRAKQEELLKIEHDLQVARSIQAGFLPTELPQPAGWEIAARFQPAREVAGDFYDAFTLSQNRRVGFIIADVVDKGVPAALFMALVRSLTRAFAQQNYSLSWTNVLENGTTNAPPVGEPGVGRGRGRSIPSTGTNALKNAVQLTNNYIADNHGEMNMFATLFFGMLDPSNGQLAYINAGHNPPYMMSQDGSPKVALKGTGPAVGMFPAATFRIDYAQMDPGDVLYLYTDGVTEARDLSRGFFGEKRLRALLNQPVPSATALLDCVESSLDAFMAGAVQFDDITMMAVRRSPVS